MILRDVHISLRSTEKLFNGTNVGAEDLLTKLALCRLNGPREDENRPSTPPRWTTHTRADRRTWSSSAMEETTAGLMGQTTRDEGVWIHEEGGKREAGLEERGRKRRKEEKNERGVDLSLCGSLSLKSHSDQIYISFQSVPSGHFNEDYAIFSHIFSKSVVF